MKPKKNASALSGAICSVLYRPYLQKYPTLPVSAFAMLASVGFVALLAAGEGFFSSLPHFTAPGWLAVVFIGISSGIGYYLWLWALNHTTPTKVTGFLTLSPITAAGLGAFLLRESISMMLFLGLACVVLGLWIALLGRAHGAHPIAIDQDVCPKCASAISVDLYRTVQKFRDSPSRPVFPARTRP